MEKQEPMLAAKYIEDHPEIEFKPLLIKKNHGRPGYVPQAHFLFEIQSSPDPENEYFSGTIGEGTKYEVYISAKGNLVIVITKRIMGDEIINVTDFPTAKEMGKSKISHGGPLEDELLQILYHDFGIVPFTVIGA